MPVVYPQYGPGLPGNPALDALRQLGSLNATDNGSTGPINPNRLTENDTWSYPPPATPPSEVSGTEHILDSLRMAYGPSPTSHELELYRRITDMDPSSISKDALFLTLYGTKNPTDEDRGIKGFGTGAVPARSEKPNPIVLHG